MGAFFPAPEISLQLLWRNAPQTSESSVPYNFMRNAPINIKDTTAKKWHGSSQVRKNKNKPFSQCRRLRFE